MNKKHRYPFHGFIGKYAVPGSVLGAGNTVVSERISGNLGFSG